VKETMPKTSSKKRTPGSDKKSPSKTAFVLGLPKHTPASEVVAKAKAEGIELTDRYVYVIRSKAKGRAGKPSGRRGRPPKSAGAKRGPELGRRAVTLATSPSGLATQFLEMALDLGLARAEDLLVSLRAKVRQAIG
jgi:hypothetical protein